VSRPEENPVPGGSAGPPPGPPAGGAPHGGPVPAGTPAGGEEVPAVVGTLAASAAALDELADLPVAEHVARYDALHGELSDALAAIDGI
jgi:hypothetical protein